MKFFFRGRAKRIQEEQPPEAVLPEFPQGMVVEVLSEENQLLCRAALYRLEGNAVELRRASEESLPQAVERVKLRGLLEDGHPLFLSGAVAESNRDFWQLRDPEVLETMDSRAFFRQRANLEGKSMLGSKFYDGKSYQPCKVLDVSGGGVRVFTEEEYQEGDLILLEFQPAPEEEAFSVACRVRRVQDSGDKGHEYGCQFLTLVGQEQERLMRAIFALQRKSIKYDR